MKRHLWTIGIVLFEMLCLWFFAALDTFAGEAPVVAVAIFWLLSGVMMLALMLLARWRPLPGMAAYTVAMLAVWLVPWNPQKQFIRDLHRVPIGASPSEAKAAIARWCKPGNDIWAVGFTDTSNSAVSAPDQAFAGSLTIPTYCAFRGTSWYDPYANGYGQVEFANGRVVGVRFVVDD